jgi:hypothetical protein
MNENNKSYPLDMFEFIHHPKYRCHNLKGLNINSKIKNSFKLCHLIVPTIFHLKITYDIKKKF